MVLTPGQRNFCHSWNRKISGNKTIFAGTVGLALAAAQVLAPPAQAEDKSATESLWGRDTLTGDWGGERPKLIADGITLGLKYTGETFSTVIGGVRRGDATDHQFLATGDIDFDKAADIEGLSGHVSALSVVGHGPSFSQVKNVLDISSNEIYGEGEVKNRLWTLWLQQTALDGQLSLRFGQISVDDEFMVSSTAANLINGTFGAFGLMFGNLPAGQPVDPYSPQNGPIYPQGAPGLRLAYVPTNNLAWLTAVTTHQPESFLRGGAQFKFDGNALIISELQYMVNQAKDAAGLPAKFTVGGWYDAGAYANLGRPGTTQGEGAVYAQIDQTVLKTDDYAVSLFLRPGMAPDQTINVITTYVDAGVGVKGLIPNRTDDVTTIGFAYAGVGNGFKAQYGGGTYEGIIEVDYTAALAPWWTVQPDFQYVIHPAFAVPGATDVAIPNIYTPPIVPNSRIPNATVLGARTTITF